MQDNGAAARHGIAAYPLEFTGSGGEYFRVWIVNVLLSIVTLGFYTPLARRRTAQYFYGHTLVADSPLEFTAQTRRMLVGFVLFVGMYAAFKLAAETGQDTAVTVMLIGGALLAPYFWGSAMRFRFNATRWRGVRLQFTASWGEVYRASWPAFLLALCWSGGIALFGALMPEARGGAGVGRAFAVLGATLLLSLLCAIRLEYNYKSLMVARGRIGGQPGRWKPQFSDFVRIWLATVGVFLVAVALVSVLLVVGVGGSFALLKGMKEGGAKAVLVGIAIGALSLFLLFLASAPARAYREARMFQLVWNNIGVSRVARFKCGLKPWGYVGLRVKNVLLTLLTLGFYRPFARVSEYRMKTHSVTLHVKGGLEQLAGQLAREEQAVGDAIADAIGLELVG
ncbi:MAG TPA: YjgN family protein [Ramlibacter sp.]|nr:YjgN family protein [Ramlibacter sp.]